MPFLKYNQRLADGYSQRLLTSSLPAPTDIWIQAASVGEALLAVDLVNKLRPDREISVLLTTNTLQGKGIVDQSEPEISLNPRINRMQSTFFPFDCPSVMHRAVQLIRPKLMVLLEAELWPAHLSALKSMGTPIVIVNGRLSAKSLKRYRYWPSLWYRLAPDRVLAMSAADAQRFAVLFGQDRVDVIPNLKFDRLDFQPLTAESSNPLRHIFAPDAKILVLGSIRQEEEDSVSRMINHIRSAQPETIICLFPRHAHRLDAWSVQLNKQRNPWILRSHIDKSVDPGWVILWDTYGELVQAYEISRAAFVGGSLAPLGGQNFLEAMSSGVVPVIGPHWDNFAWVGKEVISSGLVRLATNWQQAADQLIDVLVTPPEREIFRQKAFEFIRDRQGGMAIACRLIEEYIRNVPSK
jgi:3-deoxy-D-manno-octulosonic-acid transferase